MTKDKEIIQKQREIIKNLKEVGVFYFKCRNRATKDDVDKMETLHDKGISLESELSALESEPDKAENDWKCHCGDESTGSTKIWACNICGMEVPIEQNPDVLSKKCKEAELKYVNSDRTCGSILKAMHEYASQSLPEISDKEIEEEFSLIDIHNLNGLTGVQSINVSEINRDRRNKREGAKWYRDELKRRLR